MTQTQVQGPRLDLDPRRLTLGSLRPGETRQIKLTVSNGGKGLLQGKVSVAEGGQWLRLEQANGVVRAIVFNGIQNVAGTLVGNITVKLAGGTTTARVLPPTPVCEHGTLSFSAYSKK